VNALFVKRSMLSLELRFNLNLLLLQQLQRRLERPQNLRFLRLK
jgi:hypothetical protein